MSFYTLPKAMYNMKGIKNILSYNDNCILYKKLDYDIVDAQKLIVSHSIVYVVNGKVNVTNYDGDSIDIQNGEMIFMPRDSYLVSDFLRDGKSVEVFLLFFDHDITMKFLNGFSDNEDNKNTICKLEVTHNIRNYLENIKLMNFNTPHNKNLLELKLLEFLHLINDNQSFMKTLTSSERGKQKRNIEEIMIEHFDKNMSITDFASLSGRSLSTFNREFKQKHNTTPKQWLIEKKIQKAYKLLKEGKTVTQSAFDVGYMNVSNFIKAYKSIYNETPKTMQKNLL